MNASIQRIYMEATGHVFICGRAINWLVIDAQTMYHFYIIHLTDLTQVSVFQKHNNTATTPFPGVW